MCRVGAEAGVGAGIRVAYTRAGGHAVTFSVNPHPT